MVDQPQANPKPHPVDYAALAFVIIGAGAELANYLPAKYTGILLGVALIARLYTKWLGSQQDKDALEEGEKVGADLKVDIQVMNAPKAEVAK